MQEDEWGRSAEVGGEFIKPKDLRGHLLIVYPIGYIPHIQTRFSTADKKSDAVTVDVIDLDDKDEFGQPGKIYRNSNWMQSQLIVGLRPMIGRKVLGRIDMGVSRNGMNAPWVFNDALDDPTARERASAWSHAHPDFHPSTFNPYQPQPVSPAVQPPPQSAPQYTQPTVYTTQPQTSSGTVIYQQQPQPTGYQTAPPAPPPQRVPVQGAGQLVEGVTAEEMTVLQQMRQRQQSLEQQREQAHYNQFRDEAPF